MSEDDFSRLPAAAQAYIRELEARNRQLGKRTAPRHAVTRAFTDTVFSNSGLSLERPGIGNAKRVDPLLIGRVYPGG